MNVFISYAKEDVKKATTIFEYLQNFSGVVAWLDTKRLLPGVDWEEEVMVAIKESDLIIVLLSNISVNKKGFIQKEITEIIVSLSSFENYQESCHSLQLHLNTYRCCQL